VSFLGRFEFALDAKGRVSLPAEYRKKVEGTRFTLIQSETTHLTLFPEDIWEQVKARMAERRRERPDLKLLLRDMMARGTEVEPDKQGRILIPAFLKSAAKLDGAVLLVGQEDRIEIWNPKTYDELHTGLVADASMAEEIHRIFG
jgi:MraZ protein